MRHSPAHVSGRLMFVLISLLSLMAAINGVIGAISYAVLIRDLPSPRELPRLLAPPEGTLLEPTVIYDRSGEHLLLELQNPSAKNSQYLPIDETQDNQISNTLINATIASSDATFWTNPGYSMEGLLEDTHATIAQRLVVDLLLWNEPPGLRRALRERLLAAQIIEEFGRQQVLEWYLNSANFDRLAYGVDAAARTYFGKSAADTTLAEAAILAAAVETPGMNPHDEPELIRERQIQILQTMLVQGYITEDEYTQATKENVVFLEPEAPESELAPAYTNLVLEHLANKFDLNRIKRGGLKVITTLDFDLQFQTWCATETQLARITQDPEIIIQSWEQADCDAARLLPSSSTGDDRLESPEIDANVVVLNPSNGEILAMVGNPDPGHDPAHLPGHTPGTIISPLIYLTAFTRGYTPASLLWDVPSSLPAAMENIENPDGIFHGPVRLRIALANDYVIPVIQLLSQLGPENVSRLANQLGIYSIETPGNQSGNINLLEEGKVTLLEISQAYGVMANNGISAGVPVLDTGAATDGIPVTQPLTILNVSSSLGEIWMDCQEQKVNCAPQKKPVISAQLAYLLTHILSDETARWPSLGHPNPLEIGRPAGAKIGQTSRESDVWTIGYTPELVVGVWVGTNIDDPVNRVPISVAAGLWHAIIQFATREMPFTDWEIPPGVNAIKVCDPSGMLPTSDCPVLVNEVFQNGSEPSHPDTLFRSFQINRETERLATVFTSPELIETRVYMIIPPEASKWAQQADLPTPPEAYDVLDPLSGQGKTAGITSPEMFANISGLIAITGSAGGDTFEYYRVQVGEGLNPSTWLQINNDEYTSVTNGKLAIWDTSDLVGLYTLQLLVIDQDKNVETFTTQVTIDNQHPQISIRYPVEGQVFTYPSDSTITIQASASDDLKLDTVTFFINDIPISSLKSPPYAVPWSARIGTHTLRVRAADLAGNSSEEIIKFEVVR